LLHSSVGDPEDAEPTIGSWLWNELWSNFPAASFDFYQKLVGYDVDDGVDYWILKRGEDWRAGLRYVPDDDLEMRWVPVVRVADTADIAARVENLAGRLLVEPRPTASGGSVALLSDPSGALLIALSRSDRERVRQRGVESGGVPRRALRSRLHRWHRLLRGVLRSLSRVGQTGRLRRSSRPSTQAARPQASGRQASEASPSARCPAARRQASPASGCEAPGRQASGGLRSTHAASAQVTALSVRLRL
jgi:predicted enzyme related to lactoylglutathione lyase